jgi:transposase
MRILALDLGKFRFTGVLGVDSYRPERTVRDHPMSVDAVRTLVQEQRPDLVVIEVCPMAGAIADALAPLGTRLAVLNTCDERVKRRDAKAKTDLRDALRLLELAHARPDDLPEVFMPDPATRQWRRLIGHRSTIQARLVAAKNSVRAIFLECDVRLPPSRIAWTARFRGELTAMARRLDRIRSTIALAELEQLALLERQMDGITATLDGIAAKDPRVTALRGAYGVGPRVAEAFVAWIADPKRFRGAKHIGAYLGLAPRVHASGETVRHGSITHAGPATVRWLMVQAAWVACRKKGGWAQLTAARIAGGAKGRRKVAVTAVARQMAVRMWAMMRHGTAWREPDGAEKEATAAAQTRATTETKTKAKAKAKARPAGMAVAAT